MLSRGNLTEPLGDVEVMCRRCVRCLINTARLGGSGQGFLDLSLGINICLRHLCLGQVPALCVTYPHITCKVRVLQVAAQCFHSRSIF